MELELCAALKKLREEMPAIFAGVEMDRLTGNACRWRTFQNELCRGEIPEDVVMRSGSKKLLVVRDPFLSYLQTKLRCAR